MNPQIPLLLAVSVTDHDIDRTVATARRAEEVGVDALVLLDEPAGAASAEPATVLARIAAVTERIGLIGTFAAGYNDSLELARRLADLDYLTGGRVGWRIAPTASRDGYFGSRRPVTAVEEQIWDAGVVASVVERWSLRTELRSAQGFPVVLAEQDGPFTDVVLADEPVPGIAKKVIAQVRSAGELEHWLESGRADGVLFRPDSLEEFFGQILPSLGRGVDLERHTLRDTLGVPAPAPIPTSTPIVALAGVR